MMPSAAIPSAQRWLITIAVMTAAFMQVIDITIVTVAIPDMQGALASAPDQITWVLTSYLVAAGIFMPLTGYFNERLGRKNYLLFSIFGFTLASMLCGAASSLTAMVIFRILQGIFGAALVPLSQTILTDIYPKEDRGKAMALWGIGITLGPILGPTLAGYITDLSSWRWIFYVNAPAGALSLFLAWYAMPAAPKKFRAMDWSGFFLLALAIGCAQLVLDRGNQDDWFNSRTICLITALAVISFIAFFINNCRKKMTQSRLLDLTIFQDRNFTISCFLLMALGFGMFGSLVILPVMLQNLMNYSVLAAGLALAPRGISSMIGMILVSKLIKTIDPRLLISSGVLLSVVGAYGCTYYSLNINLWWIIWPLLLQGFGLSLIFIPLTTLAFATLPEKVNAEASGVFSLVRTLGASTGISIIITMFTRHGQIAWNQLGGFIQPYNLALAAYLRPLHLTIAHPLAAALLGSELLRQANMVASVDVFFLMSLSFLAMLPLVVLFKKPAPAANKHLAAGGE
jgi:DHA2 family multidrug resistance protein